MNIQDNATSVAVLQLEISGAPPRTGVVHMARYKIQGVTGGMDQTSGGYSLC